MAYNMVSPSKYPFRRENAKFFSEELIESVLFEFGHIWKPQRSTRDMQLRKITSFVFIPPIGRLVAYTSRKFAGFVVMKCYKTWNYINSLRPSVRERLLCNEIVMLCTRSELESDDLGLFAFMAIVVDYARLALTHEQEKLIETVVDALSYCLSSQIPGGFITVLDRMIYCSISFHYPRNYVGCDYDEKTKFATSACADSLFTPKSDFESPLKFEHVFPASTCTSTPSEDVMLELKKRKVHRELFRLKMMTEIDSQTEMEHDRSVGQLQSALLKSEQAYLAEKLVVKNDNFDNAVSEGIFILVETNDVSVQTWISTEELDKHSIEIKEPEIKKSEQKSEGEFPVCKQTLDLNTVVDKLKALEKLQIKDALTGKSCLDIANVDIKKPDVKREAGARRLNTSLPTESFISQEDSDKQSFYYDTSKDRETLLQNLEIKFPLEKDTTIDDSLGDSQFESCDVSTDDPTKIVDEDYSERKNYSFDSQIGSLDASIRTSDESRLEN